MLDTLAIARRLTDTGLSDDQADAIAGAVRQAAEAGGAVTPEMLRAEISTVRTEFAEVRTEIAAVRTEIATSQAAVFAELASRESRIYRVMLVQGGVILGAVGGAVVAIIRILG